MAPRRKRITQCKKKLKKQKQVKLAVPLEDNTASSSSSSFADIINGEEQDEMGKKQSNYSCSSSSSSCSTPKGKKYRIPEISKCPPAPMKKRPSIVVSNCSLRRKPIAFFSSPDIELFFFFARSDIPAAVV
ncbi:uncharacterized protein LOC124917556 [Impatiens glandulifera]|uniref:uncharacterized protein LOC124917556 n=1 Tax=Impatiens glandulifera TaxID=253017 RepID=UPI001FB06136|nr:uncharacterized protein LOC124917556 [Impatiens glandulifera]